MEARALRNAVEETQFLYESLAHKPVRATQRNDMTTSP